MNKAKNAKLVIEKWDGMAKIIKKYKASGDFSGIDDMENMLSQRGTSAEHVKEYLKLNVEIAKSKKSTKKGLNNE